MWADHVWADHVSVHPLSALHGAGSRPRRSPRLAIRRTASAGARRLVAPDGAPLDRCSVRNPSAVGRLPAHKPWSGCMRWAREELNLRPLPCQQNPENRCANHRSCWSRPTVDAEGKRSLCVQQNPGNRCARRRSPRSAPTVEAEGKRSVDVQGNALFRHFDTAAAGYTHRSTFSAHQSLYEADRLHPAIDPRRLTAR